jgi:hypothetical protein
MQTINTSEILDLEIDFTQLPFVVQDIANVIGLEDTLKLIDRYKGTPMYVPMQVKAEGVILKSIGSNNTIKLIKQFGGETLDMPKCSAAIRAIRNKIILNSSLSVCEAAKKFDLTPRQIRNIKKKFKSA